MGTGHAEEAPMSVTLDLVELHDPPADLTLLNGWLSLQGVRPGFSSPKSSPRTVHPSCVASAGWLAALWGFSPDTR